MSDVEWDAIECPIDSLLMILGYLIDNFFRIFPDEPLPFGIGWDKLCSFGNFIGEYLQFLQRPLLDPFVSSNIYELLKDNGFYSGISR
jgi:hypothetical protein